MGTIFEVLLPHGAPATQTSYAMDALDEIERIERELSVYQPQSTLSRLNGLAGGCFIAAGDDLLAVLQVAKRIHRMTQGAFDVTAGPLVKAWGFMDREGRKPKTEEIESALRLVGSERIEFSDSGRTVRLTEPGMQINLGGIGKGYAVDRAAMILQRGGANQFLLHGGQSSAIAFGAQHPDVPGWAVSLNHPTRSNVRIGRVFLRDRALATSGSGRQFFHFAGQRLGHVIDPRTGWPAGDLLSLTLIGDDAITVDALATGLFVLGREQAFAIAEQLPGVSMITVGPGTREGEVSIDTLRAEGVWQIECQ